MFRNESLDLGQDTVCFKILPIFERLDQEMIPFIPPVSSFALPPGAGLATVFWSSSFLFCREGENPWGSSRSSTQAPMTSRTIVRVWC